jgi:phosphohistidine phosphatase SixA
VIHRADIWLLRHGVAAQKARERTDLEDYARPLTSEGVRQSVDAGRLLATLAKVSKVYTSPRVRTVQSAVLASQELGAPFKRDKQLDHGRKHDPMEHAAEGKSVLLVCHKDISDQVRQLTGRSVAMSRGSLARVKIRDGQATLDRLLSPTDVRAMLK